jgi:hypothetical protein
MSSQDATLLARKLAALPEQAMRAHVLREYIEQGEAPEVVRVLALIHSRGRAGGPPFDVAMLALAAVLGDEALPYDLRSLLYSEAKDQEQTDLARLFFSSRALEDEVDFHRLGPPPELTLGHRKWQARDTRREVLDKLLRNPEAEVMPNLLRNPRITEPDVVALASRRPVDPAVLVHVFRSPRWITHYPVKRTLLFNPYTPSEVSLRLVSFMTRGDLKLAASLSGLAEVVREAATSMARRAGKGDEARVVDLSGTEDPE